MPNAWIIEEIRRREREKQEQPFLELPVPPPPPVEREEPREEPRGVIVIDLL